MKTDSGNMHKSEDQIRAGSSCRRAAEVYKVHKKEGGQHPQDVGAGRENENTFNLNYV